MALWRLRLLGAGLSARAGRKALAAWHAGLAQLVEQLICNHQARGSNPLTGTISFSGPEIALKALNGKEISGV